MRRDYAIGLVCIVGVAVIWTVATVIKQVIFQDLEFGYPFMVTYICNACYSLHLPTVIVGQKIGIVKKSRSESIWKVVKIGLYITPIWFLSQWTYTWGVGLTSATSSTVISTTSCIWTYIMSIVFLREKVSIWGVMGIICCVAGNILTIWGDKRKDMASNETLGDVLCAISTLFYATYTTILSKYLADDAVLISVMFGTIGAAIMVALFPCSVLLHVGGSQLTWTIFGLLVFNGLFDNVLSQYLWAFGVLKTSPTVATVGLSLTIPLAIMADGVRGVAPTLYSIMASFFVVAGFFIITLGRKHTEIENMWSTNDTKEDFSYHQVSC